MNAASTQSKMPRGLRRQAINLIFGLTLQYILGMITNLFVKFPESGTAGVFWSFVWHQGLIIAHIVVGIGILFGAIMFLVRSARSHQRPWITSSGIGLIAVLLAIIGGVTFVPTQADGFSLLMALATIAAILAYGWGLVFSGRE